MSTDTITIAITLYAPELAGAIKQLAETLAGSPTPLPKETIAPSAETAAPAPESPKTTFEEVHATLVKLKQQKSAAPVREILEVVGCKTVQDIPAEKFGEVLQMASEKLAA